VNWTDESLMAFVDGELDAEQRADIERALAGDAVLQARVAALQGQRRRVSAAFASVLDEPVPDRLAALLASAPSAPSATVVNLGEARAERVRRRSMPGWAQWGRMAAGVVLGVLLGVQFAGRGGDASLSVRDGRLVAGGPIEQALSTQLARTSGSPVAVQLSFVDRGGAYCRTFSTAAVAGLACRRDGQWVVETLVAAEGKADGAVRQASTSPRAVLDAVDQSIAGDALDAERERQARDHGWRR
jgi:negative regulator of sigma E activity